MEGTFVSKKDMKDLYDKLKHIEKQIKEMISSYEKTTNHLNNELTKYELEALPDDFHGKPISDDELLSMMEIKPEIVKESKPKGCLWKKNMSPEDRIKYKEYQKWYYHNKVKSFLTKEQLEKRKLRNRNYYLKKRAELAKLKETANELELGSILRQRCE